MDRLLGVIVVVIAISSVVAILVTGRWTEGTARGPVGLSRPNLPSTRLPSIFNPAG
jgi:hypothetical protein